MSKPTIAITGGPRTGKTTLSVRLADGLGIRQRSTDELVGRFDWSAASAEAATWFDSPGPWVVEGVAVVRALRKWLDAHPEGKPADVVVFLTEPKVAQSKGQASMGKGCSTVWAQIVDALRARGVEIVETREVTGTLVAPILQGNGA